MRYRWLAEGVGVHVKEMALQLVGEALTSKLVALTVESGAAVMFIQEVTVSGTDPAPTPRFTSLVAISYQWSARPRLLILYLSLIHISEPTRRTPISYAVFCLKKKKK